MFETLVKVIAAVEEMIWASNRPACPHQGSAASSDCILFDTPTTGGSSQTFTFDIGSVNAFGLFIGDLGTNGGTTLRLSTSQGATMDWTFPDQPDGNEKFFGVVDAMSLFVSATLTNSDARDAVYLDDVQWGYFSGVDIPEPTSLWLLGAVFIGTSAMRRRPAST